MAVSSRVASYARGKHHARNFHGSRGVKIWGYVYFKVAMCVYLPTFPRSCPRTPACTTEKVHSHELTLDVLRHIHRRLPPLPKVWSRVGCAALSTCVRGHELITHPPPARTGADLATGQTATQRHSRRHATEPLRHKGFRETFPNEVAPEPGQGKVALDRPETLRRPAWVRPGCDWAARILRATGPVAGRKTWDRNR